MTTRRVRCGGKEERNALEFLVVCPAGAGVDETAGDTCDEQLVGNHELNGRVDLLLAAGKHLVELLSLDDGTRETVKNEAMKKQHVVSVTYYE